MPKLTSWEYVALFGDACPSCGSGAVEGETSIVSSGTTAYQPVRCAACGATWEDTYQLTGYENLKLEGGS